MHIPPAVLTSAREEAIPRHEEILRVKNIADQMIRRLTEILPTGVTPFLGGSLAKGTWLRGVKDIDIFLIHETREQLDQALARYPQHFQEHGLTVRVLTGSRPYYQTRLAGYTIELIPILRITHPREAENTTDISPFHVHFVRQHLTDPDEARLFKYWLKQKEAYGAETYRHGLSGYAGELLTIIFTRFEAILAWLAAQEALPLKPPLPWENAFTGMAEGIILPDPVMPWRNAGAALSREQAMRIIRFARACHADPAVCFHAYQWPHAPPYLHVLLTADAYVTDDITGARLEKAYRQIRRAVDSFGIMDSHFTYHGDRQAEAWFKLRQWELPPLEEIHGPPLSMPDAVRAFREKHVGEQISERDGRVVWVRKREARRPCEVVHRIHMEGVSIECQQVS